MSECGKVDPARLITRGEFYDRVSEQGQQRAAMSICMTCWHTAQNHSHAHGAATKEQARHQFVNAWDNDPAEVISRDDRWRADRRDVLNRELRVLAMLVEAHRAEFDEAMAGMDTVIELGSSKARRKLA